MSASNFELRKIVSRAEAPQRMIVHLGLLVSSGTLCKPDETTTKPFRLSDSRILSRRVMCNDCFSSDVQKQRVLADALEFKIVP